MPANAMLCSTISYVDAFMANNVNSIIAAKIATNKVYR
jgi:hypothetical protein